MPASDFRIVNSLAGVPWEIKEGLKPGESYFRDGTLYADSVETVRKLVDKMNEAMGL